MEKIETHNEEQKIRIQIKELGARLKSIREAQGLSVADISNSTKIQKHYLAAIEEGNLDFLPRGPYVRSFIRQYCDYLSAQDIWKSYDSITKKQKAAEPPLPEGEESGYSDTRKVFKPKSFLWLYLLIAISLGSAGWITWQYRGDITTAATSPIEGGTSAASTDAGTEVKDVPVSGDRKAAVLSGDVISQDEQVDLSWMDGEQPVKRPPAGTLTDLPGAETAASQSGSRSVKVTAENAHVWVKISRGNTVLYEGTMKPGEYKEFEVGKDMPIRVRLGNPGRASIIWQGNKIYPVAPGSKPATKFFWPDGKITDS